MISVMIGVGLAPRRLQHDHLPGRSAGHLARLVRGRPRSTAQRAWQQFRRITVPLVGPSSFFLLIMNVIASFQVFDLIFVMTGGGPGNATSVLVTYAYRNGFQIREQGYGAAIGIVILVITLVFTFIQWRTSRTRDLVE